MADRSPSAWLGPNYSLASSVAKFNTSNNASPCLSELDDTHANASTGDIGQVLMALLDKCYTHYIGLAAGDKPTKMTLARSMSEDQNGNPVRIYNLTFILDEAVTMLVDGE